MEEKLKAYSIKSTGTMFAQCEPFSTGCECSTLTELLRSCHKDESGSIVGSHEWEEDVLEETGGDFLLIHVSMRLRHVTSRDSAAHSLVLCIA